MKKHILKQIWNQRAVNIWLWCELMLVALCLGYLTDYLYSTATTYSLPLGYDTEHVYLVKLGTVTADSKEYRNEGDSLTLLRLTDAVTRMRAYEGVEALSVSLGAHPYNQRNSSGSRGVDTTWVHGWVFTVSPQFFRVFRVTDKQGQIDPLVSAATQPDALIATEEAERKFAEHGITLLASGVKYWGAEQPEMVTRAISDNVRFTDFAPYYPAYYQCRSEVDLLRQGTSEAEFCIRVRPDADTPAFLSQFRQAMKTQLRLGNLYLMDVIGFDDLRNNFYRSNGLINEVRTHVAGLSFLLLNILLGVIGTFWIRTQQRRAELGLRMAMGSSHFGLFRLLAAEGLLLLILAFLPASLVLGNLAYADIIGNSEFPFTIARFLIGQGITFLLMALMIIIGIWYPARQAMRIQPAEALHEE